MIDSKKYCSRCAHLIEDGPGSCLCNATENPEIIKNCIRFCPDKCDKFISKKDAEYLSVTDAESQD